MDLLCFCSVLCLLCLYVRLFICALWSPAGKELICGINYFYDNAKSCVRVGHRKSSLLSAILVSNGKKICLLYCFHCF